MVHAFSFAGIKHKRASKNIPNTPHKNTGFSMDIRIKLLTQLSKKKNVMTPVMLHSGQCHYKISQLFCICQNNLT